METKGEDPAGPTAKVTETIPKQDIAPKPSDQAAVVEDVPDPDEDDLDDLDGTQQLHSCHNCTSTNFALQIC